MVGKKFILCQHWVTANDCSEGLFQVVQISLLQEPAQSAAVHCDFFGKYFADRIADIQS